jgi:hypothetical protein
MNKLIQLALKLAGAAFASLGKDDLDAVIDAVEVRLIERGNSSQENAGRFRAAIVALRAVRGLLGIPDDDADQLQPR